MSGTTGTSMTGTKRTISAIASVVLGIAVVGAVCFTLHKVSADPQKKLYATTNGTVQTSQGVLPHQFISLGVYADPCNAGAHGAATPGATNCGSHPSWPSYGPATHLVLKPHSYVTITLTVYDSGENLNNAYFGKVIGTVDAAGSVSNTATYDGVAQTALAPTDVEHTFTLHGLPTSTQDPLFVNVPLPKNTDAEMADYNKKYSDSYDHTILNKGHVVTFSFITGGKGEYVWNCEYPCGDGTYRGFGAVMGQVGYMAGKVSVA